MERKEAKTIGKQSYRKYVILAVEWIKISMDPNHTLRKRITYTESHKLLVIHDIIHLCMSNVNS